MDTPLTITFGQNLLSPKKSIFVPKPIETPQSPKTLFDSKPLFA